MDQTSASHFFTLRIWSEVDEEGGARWRGQLRHIPSDSTCYFRDWASLVPLLLSIMRQHPPTDPDPDLKASEELNE